jgi:hypothetical protein
MATYTVKVTGTGKYGQAWLTRVDTSASITSSTSFSVEEGTLIVCKSNGSISVDGTRVCDDYVLCVCCNVEIELYGNSQASTITITRDYTDGSFGNHRTLINGTGYSIKKGKTICDGTAYNIISGKVLVNGTGYGFSFKKRTLKIVMHRLSGSSGYGLEKVSVNGRTYTNIQSQTVEVESGTRIICYVKSSDSSSTAIIQSNGGTVTQSTSTNWIEYSFTAYTDVSIAITSGAYRGSIEISRA